MILRKIRQSNKYKYIGYWVSIHESKQIIDLDFGILLPHPKDFIDPLWDEKEKSKIFDYLVRGKENFAWKGYSYCRFGCSNVLGFRDLTDGTYIWPEGFSHYIEKHYVKPPKEFIDHVMQFSI